MNLTTKIVGLGFFALVSVFAVASWDVARGRVPETDAPLLIDLLQAPDERTCTRDVARIVERHLRPGMPRADVVRLLEAATVKPPRPWFWTPILEDRVADQGAALSFTRTLRFTAFGNHKLIGVATFENGLLSGLTARVSCAFG